MKYYIRIILGIILAAILAEAVHTHVGIPAPSYSPFINFMSYVTKPLEAIGIAIIYYLLGDRLPTQSRLFKGFLLACIILLAEGQLIRQPFMNLLFPSNTLGGILLRQLEKWLEVIVMCIIIAYTIKPYNTKK